MTASRSLAIFAQQNNKPIIGIVSGVGPLAGSDVLAKVFKHAALAHSAVEDDEYPDLLLINHGISGVDNSGAMSGRFEQDIVAMVRHLESQGANVIGIACNTAHLYLDSIRTLPQTTIVNLIDTVSGVAAESLENYLLLTSLTSKQQKLYHGYLERHNVVFKQTTNAQQALLDHAIGLVMTHKLAEAGAVMNKVLVSAKRAGFQAVIAGCTELPIAIDYASESSGLKVIDSNHELARALLDHYYKRLA